jgi:hypothetical protein
MRFGFDQVLSVARVQEPARDSCHSIDALPIATRLGGARANPFDPGFDIDLCENGFERYQSLCNMKYDRGWFGFGTDGDGDIR